MKFLVVLALIAMAMAEPEADPALIYTTNTLPLTSAVHHSPLVYTATGGVHQPIVYNSALQTPVVYNTIPHYNHYYGKREAEAEPEADPALIYTTNTLPLASAVHHSPLVYTATGGVHQPIVYNSALQTPVVYKTLPVAEKTEKVSTPVVYTHALPLHKPLVYNSAVQTPLIYNSPLTYNVPRVYNTALTTPVLSKVFPSLKTLTTTPIVSHIAKREAEAEADPALVYTTAGVHSPLVYTHATAGVHSPLVYNTAVQTPVVYNRRLQTPLVYNTAVQTPLVYNTAVQTPVVYNTAAHSPLLKTVDNAVVPTLDGYIHSSHVGVCTNNLGVRVPC